MKRLQLFREHKYVWSGVLLLTLILGIAILAPYIAPCDPWAMGTPYLRPNSEHWLGTNDIGQDIFSELIYGTRISLFIGLSAAFITTVIGTTIGIIYYCFMCNFMGRNWTLSTCTGYAVKTATIY